MRVIAGKAKGTKLLSVPGDTTRPILDRVKTPLFDILRPEIQGVRMLDLFAGSGSVGIEAISQGAEHCTFLDLAKKATDTIKKNLESARLGEQSEVRTTDAFAYLRNTSKTFDLIYIAPPQYKGLWLEALQCIGERPSLVEDDGLMVVQIDPKEQEAFTLRAFEVEQERKYGNTLFMFLRKT